MKLTKILVLFFCVTTFLHAQVEMGIKEVDPGSTPHQLTLFYIFYREYTTIPNWNSQLVMIRYSATLPVPASFISSVDSHNCFLWEGFYVGDYNGDRYIVYNDADGALSCPFNNGATVDMFTLTFDASSTPLATADFELVPPGDPSIVHFGFGAPAINNANLGANEFTAFNPGQVMNLALPVQLTDFRVHAEGADAVLEWETASELNFSHYEIERSSDERSWRGIGRVDGRGAVEERMHYRWVDEKALRHPSVRQWYYRLKMIDADGTYEYSPIRHLSVARTGKEIKLFPNPTKSSFQLQLADFSGDGQGEVRIFDTAGRLVLSEKKALGGSLQIDISGLSAGIYQVQLLAGSELFQAGKITVLP